MAGLLSGIVPRERMGEADPRRRSEEDGSSSSFLSTDRILEPYITIRRFSETSEEEARSEKLEAATIVSLLMFVHRNGNPPRDGRVGGRLRRVNGDLLRGQQRRRRVFPDEMACRRLFRECQLAWPRSFVQEEMQRFGSGYLIECFRHSVLRLCFHASLRRVPCNDDAGVAANDGFESSKVA